MKFVLVALADRADHDGHCWPSARDIASMTGQTERSVYNQIDALIELGLITKKARRRSSGYKASNGYNLHIGISREAHDEPRSPETVSPERPSGERRSPENDDNSCLNDVHININPPSEALSEPSVEPSGKTRAKGFLREFE